MKKQTLITTLLEIAMDFACDCDRLKQTLPHFAQYCKGAAEAYVSIAEALMRQEGVA
jgi:hypothetical protein